MSRSDAQFIAGILGLFLGWLGLAALLMTTHCGGPSFDGEGVFISVTWPDAAPSTSGPDALDQAAPPVTPDASGPLLEAASDAGAPEVSTLEDAPRELTADGWDPDVELAPYCEEPPGEASPRCTAYFAARGQTSKTACCMKSHACGAVVGVNGMAYCQEWN